MKYAWYLDDDNTGIEFIGMGNEPMQLINALALTCDTSAEKAFSVPAFETGIIAKKVKYGEDFDVDGEHSILDEIAFEEWDGKNYMVITKAYSSYWNVPLPIKKLYNKCCIRNVYATKSTVTITWEYHKKQHKFVLAKEKDFENKSFEKMVDETTYYSIQDFCKANL